MLKKSKNLFKKKNKTTNFNKKTHLDPHVCVSYVLYDSLIRYDSYNMHLRIKRFMSTYDMKLFVHDRIHIVRYWQLCVCVYIYIYIITIVITVSWGAFLLPIWYLGRPRLHFRLKIQLEVYWHYKKRRL